MSCVSVVRAVLVRLLFAVHGVASIWLLTTVTRDDRYWYMAATLGLLLLELSVTLGKKGGKEWKWFCPSVFIYLMCVVPAIWFLELHEMDKRIVNRRQTNLTATAHELLQASDLLNDSRETEEELRATLGTVLGVNLEIRIPLKLKSEEWIKATEQLLLLLLILGRWLMPKGKLTHDQLSQLLLVYIGTAADIVEFFDAFKEDVVKYEPLLCMSILGMWSFSLIQFSLVLTAARARRDQTGLVPVRRHRSKSKKKKDGACCSADVYGIIISILLQDAPFLVLRMLLIFKYNVLSYTNMFFTSKNTVVIILLIYRLVVVQLEKRREHHHGEGDSNVNNNDNDNDDDDDKKDEKDGGKGCGGGRDKRRRGKRGEVETGFLKNHHSNNNNNNNRTDRSPSQPFILSPISSAQSQPQLLQLPQQHSHHHQQQQQQQQSATTSGRSSNSSNGFYVLLSRSSTPCREDSGLGLGMGSLGNITITPINRSVQTGRQAGVAGGGDGDGGDGGGAGEGSVVENDERGEGERGGGRWWAVKTVGPEGEGTGETVKTARGNGTLKAREIDVGRCAEIGGRGIDGRRFDNERFGERGIGVLERAECGNVVGRGGGGEGLPGNGRLCSYGARDAGVAREGVSGTGLSIVGKRETVVTATLAGIPRTAEPPRGPAGRGQGRDCGRRLEAEPDGWGRSVCMGDIHQLNSPV